MDIGTIFGILGGFALIVIAILMGGGSEAFVNIPSVFITVGGTLAATLINYPISVIFHLVSIVKNTFFYKVLKEEEIIDTIIELAYSYRKDGPIGIEKKAAHINHAFFKRSINLILEGVKESALDTMLFKEMHSIRERHRVGQDVLLSMGNYAPAFGMIGTLIGLVQMLRKLNDPSSIGSGMAVALITTFYGALLANLVCIPLAGKLKERSSEELLICDLIREGMVAMSKGDTPRLVREKVLAFSDQRVRSKLQSK